MTEQLSIAHSILVAKVSSRVYIVIRETDKKYLLWQMVHSCQEKL